MATSTEAQTLGSIGALLDGFDAALVDHGARLACAQQARVLASRLTALSATLLAQADATGESLRLAGTPTTTWLATRAGMSKREACGMLHQARELATHQHVSTAATAGQISISQARTIHRVLDGFSDLNQDQQTEAETTMVELASSMDTDRLAKTGPAVLAKVAPEQSNQRLEQRLQRQTEAARRNRALVFGRDNNGSVTFTGSLPLVDGEAWIAILDAYTESSRRNAIEERDPLTPVLTPQQRRADALLAMIGSHSEQRRAPRLGGDRPRVVVTLSYAQLLTDAAGAGHVGADEPISAGDLRRLCCDADLLPAVLGTNSEVLDVGREHRLVTPPIRTALSQRDCGCTFPGCQTRATACEAHHIQPWWAGGHTSLANLVLLCHHHHALVEPAKHTTRDQWEVRIAQDGLPEFIPPRRYDPQRKPLRQPRTPIATRQTPTEKAPTKRPPAQQTPTERTPTGTAPTAA